MIVGLPTAIGSFSWLTAGSLLGKPMGKSERVQPERKGCARHALRRAHAAEESPMTEKRISLRETMRRALPRRTYPFLIAILLLAGLAMVCPGFVQPAAAQASALENGPPPPPDDPATPPAATPAPSAPASSPAPSASGTPADKPAAPGEASAVPADTAPEQPAWD